MLTDTTKIQPFTPEMNGNRRNIGKIYANNTIKTAVHVLQTAKHTEKHPKTPEKWLCNGNRGKIFVWGVLLPKNGKKYAVAHTTPKCEFTCI